MISPKNARCGAGLMVYRSKLAEREHFKSIVRFDCNEDSEPIDHWVNFREGISAKSRIAGFR